MKRDFLKNLGIEDKEIIDKILDENSADIGKAKGDTEELNRQITDLENKLSKKTSEYDGLKESTKDYDDLTARVKQLDLDNTQLLADKKQLELDLDTKVSELLKTHETENKVRDRKAKNVKAVMALIDKDKDIDQQLDDLVNGEETSFLFGEDKPTLSGTKLNDPPSNGGNPPTQSTLGDAIAKALGK